MKARPRKFSNEDLALAYELRTCGVSWKLISRHIGEGIRDCLNHAKAHGMIR